VTASLGLSFAPAGRVRDITALITAADEALYEAKRRGETGWLRRCQPGRIQPQDESTDAFLVFEPTPESEATGTRNGVSGKL